MVAKRLLALVGRKAAHVFEWRFVHAERIQLMLREVADREALTAAKIARELREHPHDRLDEGGLAGAVHAQNADAVARADRKRDVPKNRQVFIARRETFRVDEVLGEAFGLRKFKAPLALRAHGLDRLQALEHLDARLRLTGF